MARRVLNKLSAIAVAKLDKPGRHSDGGGLYLAIDGAASRRRWVFMYVRGGRRTELGLGSGRDLPLARARKEAAKLREMLAAGEDPQAERENGGRTMSFGECADAYIEAMSPGWRNPRHAEQWRMTLGEYCKPMRGKTVREITTEDVLGVLQPLWQRAPETAARLRGRIENVLDAAKARGLRSGENPARWRGHLAQLLPKRQKLSRGNHAALPWGEMPAFMAGLRGRPGVAARALEFTVLTAARTSEALGAQWSEIDLEARLWVIPAARMKAAREHRVPLSPRAAELLRAMREPGAAGHVFPGPKPGAAPSNMALLMLLRRMGSDVTTHGFRASFKTWASEATSFPPELSEAALAHVISDKTAAAYQRGDLLDRRRKLMEAWADFCASRPADKVVAFVKAQPAASAR